MCVVYRPRDAKIIEGNVGYSILRRIIVSNFFKGILTEEGMFYKTQHHVFMPQFENVNNIKFVK